jgi:glucose/arabinose dehydrogenase
MQVPGVMPSQAIQRGCALCAVLALAARGETAKLRVADGTGAHPTVSPPHDTVIPTVNIAPASGWPVGATRLPAPGQQVQEFAAGLEHPRWHYLLPNGDGVADLRSIFIKGLHSPFGMALVGQTRYVANTDAVLSFSYANGDAHITAAGVRNPNGLSWEPDSGAFHGWPYCYFGNHADPSMTAKPAAAAAAPIASATTPDYALGPHTASLGLTSSRGSALAEPFTSGMFVGQHGSWNRKPYSGYKVIFVPFAKGLPSAASVDVLTGFLNEEGKAHGRPVGVLIDETGAQLVADDVGNKVWRVSAKR